MHSMCIQALSETQRSEAEVAHGFRVLKFRTGSDGAGAILILDPPAKRESIISRLKITAYLRQNIDSWVDFANNVDHMALGLQHQDLLFVSGTTKTTRWALAGFQDDAYRDKEGLALRFPNVDGNAIFLVRIGDMVLPVSNWRCGPQSQNASMARSAGPSGSAEVSDRAEDSGGRLQQQNQCVFIHYYKMRRRMFGLGIAIQAAAGDHQLPPGPSDQEMKTITSAGSRGSSSSEDLTGYKQVSKNASRVHLLLNTL